MATQPKPWKAEYAKSGRSSCKACKKPIDKEKLRLGKMVQATQFDGFMPMWNHADCILKKSKQIKVLDDVEGLESLRWEDQQRLRKYIEGAQGGETLNASNPDDGECSVEVSQTSRATCRRCNTKILKGEIRISKGQGKASAWHHAKCFMEMSPTIGVQKLSGWESLSASDQAVVLAFVKKDSSSSQGEMEDEKELLPEAKLKGGAKRKRAVGTDTKSKLPKAEEVASTAKKLSDRNDNNQEDEHSKASDEESKLEAQTKALWGLKDDLKKHVTTSELREMLEANDQDTRGSELDLRDRW